MDTATSPEAPKPSADIKTPETQNPLVQQLEPPKQDPLSPKLALLAKKERAALKRAQEIKEMESRIAEREAKLKQLEELREKAKQDPDTALNQLGWDYEKLTNYYLNHKQVTPDMQVKAVEERVTAFINEQKEKEAKAKEEARLHAEKEVQESLKTWEGEVKEFISKQTDEYELINMHQAYNMVTDLIKENWQKNKKLLNTEEAAKHVESYLEHLIEQSIQSKRLKSKYSSKTEEVKEDSNVKESVTLSNSMGSSMPGSLPAKSDQERIQRALAKLNK